MPMMLSVRSTGAVFGAAACLTLISFAGGCASSGASGGAAFARPAAVSPLDPPAGFDESQRDRWALTRLIGAWDFEGWYDPAGQERRTAQGIASGVVEHEYFLLFDTGLVVEQGDDAQLETGSMLFSVEHGVGLVLTLWSVSSPEVHRYRGSIEADGSRFAFSNIRISETGETGDAVIRFETDDRFVIELTRGSGDAASVAARYTFVRAE